MKTCENCGAHLNSYNRTRFCALCNRQRTEERSGKGLKVPGPHHIRKDGK